MSLGSLKISELRRPLFRFFSFFAIFFIEMSPLYEQLAKLTKEQLIERVIQLTASTTPATTAAASKTVNAISGLTNAQRPFHFEKHMQRRIALKVMYLGWNYCGLAWQDVHINTVELQLFYALKKVRLIQDQDACEFTRCGRTDKGVSALCQVGF